MTRDVSSLPTELLIEIFRIATDNPVRDIDLLASWSPFEPVHSNESGQAEKDALRVKSAIGLTSHQFRALVMPFLYEDIWVRHGSHELLLSLWKDTTLRSYVKRIAMTFDDENKSEEDVKAMVEDARNILSCCPNVRIVQRPRPEIQEEIKNHDVPPLEGFELPHLSRVNWYNGPGDDVFIAGPSPKFAWTSGSLRVLIMGKDDIPQEQNGEDRQETVPLQQRPQQLDEPLKPFVRLPNLHTLGVRSLSAFSHSRQPYDDVTFEVPALRCLVLARPEAMFNLIDGPLSHYTNQIYVIELYPDFRFLRHDFVATLLTRCPNTTDLYIPIFTTRPPYPNEVPRVILEFTSVSCVHLHAGFPVSGYSYKEQSWWAMVEGHFQGICGPGSRFTELKQVELSGLEWKESLEDNRILPSLRLALGRGIELYSTDTGIQCMLENLTKSFERGKL